jgi:SsrA-binding protein
MKTVPRKGAKAPTVPAAERPDRLYATNRRARFDYFIVESLEVGLVLTGTEIKSVRAGRANITEAFAKIERGELWLLNTHIAPYEAAGGFAHHELTRPRKLLAHRRQITHLAGLAAESGNTLVPLRLYDRNGHVKIELGVARGKHSYDKRQAIAKRDADRQIARAMRVNAR